MKTAVDRKAEFETMRKQYETEEKKWNGTFARISTFRIITFLLGAAGLIIGISEKKLIFTIVGALLLIAFIVLIRIHSEVVQKQELAAGKKTVCARYVARYDDEWRTFEEDGSAYLKPEDSVSADVDLLGKNSLYQMISVCHTEVGKEKLARRLQDRFVPEQELEERRKAIAELGGKAEFAVRFETAGYAVEKGKKRFNPMAFEKFCGDENVGKLPVFAQVVRILFPVLEIAALVLFLGGVIHYGYALGGFLIILAFSWITKTVTDAVILPTYHASAVSGDYETMLSLIAEQDFTSPLLQEMKERAGGESGAMMAFRKLRGISQAYNISFNPLIHQLLSGFFLWDFQLAFLVNRWKKKYGKQVAGCFSMLGDMEELLSFAVLGMVRDTGEAQVQFGNQSVSLAGEDLYHPLLQPDQAQANSVTLASGITIITGSNMSGKTTFLRTIAVNLVLAYLGAPVCAKHLQASYMKLFTSMRVRDDVAHGISTFYAEILRIKEMAEYRKQDCPMLCLIDEIFKGTNSADRIVGASEVIVKLAGEKCMTVVSTHDFELCSLKDGNGTLAVNYHFQEYYEEDQLRFDYKIRDGRCTTTNARAILRMAGFDVK